MIGPNIWGPPGWKFIHFITLGYPKYPSEEQKQKYYNFFHALKYVIPCSICASHFASNLETNPLSPEVLANKTNLINWGIDMHNIVNKKNGKKVYTYEEGLKEILKPNYCANKDEKPVETINVNTFTNTLPNKNNNWLHCSYIINIILIIILFFFIYKYIKI